MDPEYRNRLYQRYASDRNPLVTPNRLLDLAPRLPYLRRIVERHFPPDRNATILEIGCGHGALIHVARQCGYKNISGIDSSPEQVAIASRLGIGGVSHGDLFGVLRSARDDTIDVVVAFDVFEHLNLAEVLALADEMYRVLRPRGRVIIHTVNGGSPFFGSVLYGDATHEMAFTEESIRQILRSGGFDHVQSYEAGPVPHGIVSSGRVLLWRLLKRLLWLMTVAETGSMLKAGILTRNFVSVGIK
jgi:2-polyprenyl-3-methyl-5-hydroxy-6-metoxy-1,4-benzoquinol methylase